MSMRIRRPLAPLVLLCAGGALACSDARGSALEAGDPATAAAEVRSVRTALVEEQTWERTLQVTGELEAYEEATLAALVPGRLELMVVDLGSRVEAGDEIAAVELRDYELGVAQAEAAWRAARARLALEGEQEIDPERVAVVREARSELADAARQLERLTSLSTDNVVAASALDAAQARHSIAESRLSAAFEDVAGREALLEQRKVELELARAELADARIVAPFAGAIAERLADRGDYVSVGTPVARLVRYDPLRLRLAIPERRAHEIQAGQQARIELEAHEQPILASVDRLSPELDAANRTLAIELELDNPDGALRPGSFARATLVVDPEARTLVVPRAALVRFAGIDKVFVVEEGRAVERPITVGRADEQRVEVLGGLESGARVVLAPGGLASGAEVRVED
jgi:RND family efflux transporter MFP subunit